MDSRFKLQIYNRIIEKYDLERYSLKDEYIDMDYVYKVFEIYSYIPNQVWHICKLCLNSKQENEIVTTIKSNIEQSSILCKKLGFKALYVGSHPAYGEEDVTSYGMKSEMLVRCKATSFHHILRNCSVCLRFLFWETDMCDSILVANINCICRYRKERTWAEKKLLSFALCSLLSHTDIDEDANYKSLAKIVYPKLPIGLL